MTDLIVARQPILDRKQELYAYELLFRPGATDQSAAVNGDAASARVLLTSLVEMGLERVVGDRFAFINFTGALLQSDLIRLLPKERIVLEVLESVRVDAAMIEAIRALAAQGYRFALDDFVYRPENADLIPHAEFIKLDVLALGRDGVRAQLDLLRGAKATLIAEKVETHEEWQWCTEQGFHMFQGYYFCRPRVIAGKALPTSQMTVLVLLAKLQDPNVNFTEIDAMVRRDVGLTHRLLKIINSAQYSLPRKIESIKEALVMLGLRFTRMWASLIALAAVKQTPREAFTTTLVRARMCETLAGKAGQNPADTYFLVGLLSTLDTLLDRPLDAVMRELPLSDAMRNAILKREGDMGAALACAIAQERGDWDAVRYHKLEAPQIQTAYLDALTWAQEVNAKMED